MAQQQFCLKWNNHMNNMMEVFRKLLAKESMVDVTLACDGLSLKAHKIILSACSPFFSNLFLDNPCKHPIVIMKDMRYSELKAIIDFMYNGEVNVAQEQLSALMKTAETLRVKGLAEVTNEKGSSNQSQDEPSHRSVPRSDSPPQSKRRRGRVRKRSYSDRSDDSNEPKSKQPPSPDIEELSCDASMDNSTSASFTNMQSQVPMQSHQRNSFHNSSAVSQDPQVEEPASADESEFGVEPAKLLEQTLTTDDLSNQRRGRSAGSSNYEMQRRPRGSTDHSSNIVPSSVPSESLSSNQQPDSPPDIKPELLELDPPMSPVAGPSHSSDNSMMYMDQSSLSSHPGPSGYQDNALVPVDSNPQGHRGSEKTSQKIPVDLLPILKKIPGLQIFQSKAPAQAAAPIRQAPKQHFQQPPIMVQKKFLPPSQPPKPKPSNYYHCEFCPYEANTPEEVKKHLDEFHKAFKGPHCTVCNKEFANNNRLKAHMQTHNEAKEHVCMYCEKKFKHISSLNTHVKSHLSFEQFKCQYCDKMFQSDTSLKKHMIVQHQSRG